MEPFCRGALGSKVKQVDAGRSGATHKTRSDGIGASAPGPYAFQAETVQYVGRLGRIPATTRAARLLDRITA